MWIEKEDGALVNTVSLIAIRAKRLANTFVVMGETGMDDFILAERPTLDAAKATQRRIANALAYDIKILRLSKNEVAGDEVAGEDVPTEMSRVEEYEETARRG